MAKPIDITPVKPNVWVALMEGEPEGGTIIRRFERWTCTCSAEDGDCRHVLAARSLIAKAAQAVTEIGDNESTPAAVHVTKIKTRARKHDAKVDAEKPAEATGPVTIVERARAPRPVVVRDSAVTAKTSVQAEVAA